MAALNTAKKTLPNKGQYLFLMLLVTGILGIIFSPILTLIRIVYTMGQLLHNPAYIEENYAHQKKAEKRP